MILSTRSGVGLHARVGPQHQLGKCYSLSLNSYFNVFSSNNVSTSFEGYNTDRAHISNSTVETTLPAVNNPAHNIPHQIDYARLSIPTLVFRDGYSTRRRPSHQHDPLRHHL